jgi:predicted nucleic acid-binding protein
VPSSNVARRWVVNASPLILLSKVGKLDLIDALASEVAIPAAVVDELEDGPGDDPSRRAAQAIANARILPAESVDPLVERWDLGAGESGVLTFALRNRSFEAVLDDRAARNCAAALGIATRGTLGILLLAKREGALAAVAPTIAALKTAGMYLDASLERSALELAGEA